MFDQLAAELELPFVRNGSYIIFSAAWERLLIPAFYHRARKGHIPGVRYVPRGELLRLQPEVAAGPRARSTPAPRASCAPTG